MLNMTRKYLCGLGIALLTTTLAADHRWLTAADARLTTRENISTLTSSRTSVFLASFSALRGILTTPPSTFQPAVSVMNFSAASSR